MTGYIPATVLVTGATGDFGRAFAARFDALGCALILAGRDQEKLGALSRALKGKNHVLCFDMKDRAAMEKSISSLPADFQNIDLLINNAGLALGLDHAPQTDQDDWDTMIDVNCKALAALTRLVLPGMAARKKGHIINIGSTAGTYPYPGGNVYCASKAFVKQFSLALRADLAGTNIRVTNIEPGMVQTQFSEVRFKGDTQKAASVYENTKPLTAADVAESVIWAATLPPHFNVNRLEIMPTAQSFGPLAVERFN
ncbi:MAG: SDR family NAD(P)-dependent oxidoreductase [Alphaproteobacteria bacterium]|nr:SDR family NAD(P)-dependent oxidoreductase [Alphaproteobacteria bacterium]